MNEFIDLHDLKFKNYMPLSAELNSLLIIYWKQIKYEVDVCSNKNKFIIKDIVDILNLKDQINCIDIIDNNLYIGGNYNFREKKLTLNINKLIELRNLNIISNETFVVEYLTVLFHEIFHAIQYQYMYNYNDYLISFMKQISLKIKENMNLNNQLHDLIPDEREASIKSAKLLYDFAVQNDDLALEEYNEIYQNLNYYVKNGYLYAKKLSIYPYQSILRFDNMVPKIDYNQVDVYNKIIYGFDLENNPTPSLLINEGNKRLLYRKEKKYE